MLLDRQGNLTVDNETCEGITPLRRPPRPLTSDCQPGHQAKKKPAIIATGLLFFTRLALIYAGSPIPHSKRNSANSGSNLREYPVASLPVRTRIMFSSTVFRTVSAEYLLCWAE